MSCVLTHEKNARKPLLGRPDEAAAAPLLLYNIHYKSYKYKTTTWYLNGFPTGIATLGQQYNVGEKPTVIILYTFINHHA